ncbi:hypothetical protein BD289DRAFT_427251 [Coniella lustricola]|uniref:EF hand domain-containing protein n=1 Tax=Coniella lustricola TaxID=2025994 RepID=A0A2T3AFE3_9PEZI|nr:hypothetical protein BD289DRAFT_427251 [Coniella lustricola]
MDSTSSAAATLTRPRLAIQLITGLAAAFIVYSAWNQRADPSSSSSPSFADAATNGNASGLHRSNAVRRSERATRRQIEAALQDLANRGYDSEQRQELEAILQQHFAHNDNQTSQTISPQTSRPDDADSSPQSNAAAASDTPARRPLTSQRDDNEREAETVAGDEWQDDMWSMPAPRSGHNIVGLLFRVSEDNARRNAYVHRGCMCNACGLLPIRGIRYRCANCADFDLCETCEAQGLHIKTHVFYKVKVPAPPLGPNSMQPVWYPGDPDTALKSLPNSLIKHLSRETGFERPELEALWEQWTFIANTEWRDDPDELYLAADRRTFERYLVPSSGTKRSAPNLIHDRMFAFYDTNGDDLISFPEFLKGLSYKKGKERLERIFKGYDIDGDGYISRRDCLRIFRTYYVLYKHMHGDVIEGLDQQALHNTETQQLVTGRQPLSSHFGREGRVPEADHRHPMEGKGFHSNGEVYVNDGKSRVVNESKPDTANREEILSSLFNHAEPEYGTRVYRSTAEHVTSPTTDEVARIHYEAMLNPTTRVPELVGLLVGESRNIQPSELAQETIDDQQHNNHDSDSEEDTSVEDGATESIRPVSEHVALANGVTSADAGSQTAAVLREAGVEQWTNRVPTESQLRAQHLRLEAHRKQANNRKIRDAVRKKLFDRWKKRTFYLMEEEGTSAPEGFEAEDDVLADMSLTDGFESKDGQPALSARSRSSSKVRFAEDTDDYEIRSNPSTSSRSVPERWGGMEIPDAERDMGKEILYTVTQQAFNEILDTLFYEKEEIAVKAAQSREWRDAYRDVLDTIDGSQSKRSQSQQSCNEDGKIKVLVEVDENKPIQNRNLDELLAVSGYTLDESLARDAGAEESLQNGDGNASAEEDEDYAESSSDSGSDYTEGSVDARDMTMPQFRPNSEADFEQLNNKASQRGKHAALNGANGGSSPNHHTTSRPRQRPLTRPPRAALLEWKKHDAAEAEAKERGGWGRLTLAEFKHIWHREESGPRRLDYLGTWIDFCIP